MLLTRGNGTYKKPVEKYLHFVETLLRYAVTWRMHRTTTFIKYHYQLFKNALHKLILGLILSIRGFDRYSTVNQSSNSSAITLPLGYKIMVNISGIISHIHMQSQYKSYSWLKNQPVQYYIFVFRDFKTLLQSLNQVSHILLFLVIILSENDRLL